MSSPNENITNELKTSLENIGIDKVVKFCNDLLSRLDYREFISLDLFNIDGVLYLGEFTRTPGAFVYHIFDQDSIDTILIFPRGKYINKIRADFLPFWASTYSYS